MVSILPINNAEISKLNQIKIKPAESEKISSTVTDAVKVGASALAAAAGVSTFLADFNKTVDEENYFQLKIY